MLSNKSLVIVAGPNGSGKTTFVENTFPDVIARNKFINADNFARDIYPDNVSKVAIQAGKKFLMKIDGLLLGKEGFIIETTLAGKTLLKKIEKARENGFHIRLIFLCLSSASLCDFRVKARVASGGHNIPLIDIKRRYYRGLLNLSHYRNFVDIFELYDADSVPSLILSKSVREGEKVYDHELLKKFFFILKESKSFLALG